MASLQLTRTMLQYNLAEARKHDPSNNLSCIERLQELYDECNGIYREMGVVDYSIKVFIPIKLRMQEHLADNYLDEATNYWEKLGPLQVQRRNRKGAKHGGDQFVSVEGYILRRVDTHGVTRWHSHDFNWHYKNLKEFRAMLKNYFGATV
jgi:hypothetical protein